MSADQHLAPGAMPPSRPDTLARPKAYGDLLAALDTAGWTYTVRWGLYDDGLTEVKLIAVAPWDQLLRVEVTWRSPDGVTPLKRTWCALGRPYRRTGPDSLRALHDLIAAVPEPREATEEMTHG